MDTVEDVRVGAGTPPALRRRADGGGDTPSSPAHLSAGLLAQHRQAFLERDDASLMQAKAPAGPALAAVAAAAVDAPDTDVACMSAGSACSSRLATSLSSRASSVGSLAAAAKPHLRQSSRMRPPVAASNAAAAPEDHMGPDGQAEAAVQADVHANTDVGHGHGGGDTADGEYGAGSGAVGRLQQLHAQDPGMRRLRGDSAAMRVQPRSGSGSVRLVRGVAGPGGSRRMAFAGALQVLPSGIQPLPPPVPRPVAVAAPAVPPAVGGALLVGASGTSSGAGSAMPRYLQLRQQRLRHEEPVSEGQERVSAGGGGAVSTTGRARDESAVSLRSAEAEEGQEEEQQQQLPTRLGQTDAPDTAPEAGSAASGGAAAPAKTATLWRKIAGLISSGGGARHAEAPPALAASPATPAQPSPAAPGARLMPSPPRQRPPGPHDSRLLHHKRFRRERSNPVLAEAAGRALAAPPSPMPTTAWGDPTAAGRGEGGLGAAVLRPPDSAAAAALQPGTTQQPRTEAKPRAPPPPPLALQAGEAPRAPSTLTSPVGHGISALSSPGSGGSGSGSGAASILAGRSFQRRSNVVLPEPLLDGHSASRSSVVVVPAVPMPPPTPTALSVSSRSMPQAATEGDMASTPDPLRLLQKSSSSARLHDTEETALAVVASDAGGGRVHASSTEPGFSTAVAVGLWDAVATATAAAMAPAELAELSLPGSVAGVASLSQACSVRVAPVGPGGRANLRPMRSSPLDAAPDGNSSRGSCGSGPTDAQSGNRGQPKPSRPRSVSHGGNAGGSTSANGTQALGWWRRLSKAISHSGVVASLAAAPVQPRPCTRASDSGATSAKTDGSDVPPQASLASPTAAPTPAQQLSPTPAPPKAPRLSASPSITRTSGSPPLLRSSETFGASLLATAAALGLGRASASPAPHDSRIVHRRRIKAAGSERPPSMLVAAWAAVEADAARSPGPASAAVSERAPHNRLPSQALQAPHAAGIIPEQLQSPGASFSGGRSIVSYSMLPTAADGCGTAHEPPGDRSSNSGAAGGDAAGRGGLVFDMLHGEYGHGSGLARVSQGLRAAAPAVPSSASQCDDELSVGPAAANGAIAATGGDAGDPGAPGGALFTLRRSAPGSLAAAAPSLRSPTSLATAVGPRPAPEPERLAWGLVQRHGPAAAAPEAGSGGGPPLAGGRVLPGGFRVSASGAEHPLGRLLDLEVMAAASGAGEDAPVLRVRADGRGGWGRGR
ncbi:hypothetical protein HYH02_001553 [Chlamydomonas schloesseri]|uniref:Uncharacterized protein n=1 Tax=Chlamydomonas schloesseri TaxID=2026947 RepID=A0A835WSE2_9CHLO|nr:hypothetical protein HYH02_001553 [Chlamydomonas schloesseri]|eukprot:KAG2453329.1 hypothetical protein HYH02_001553 [Chlamydomonas schloesseri]